MDRLNSANPGPAAGSRSAETSIAVSGMDCASCVAHVQKAAESVAGVEGCAVSLARGRAVVRFDPGATDAGKIAAAITQAGYMAAPEAADDAANAEQERLRRQAAHSHAWLRRAIVGVALWLPVELTHWMLMAFGGHQAGMHGGMGLSLGWLDWAALITSTIAIGYVGKGFYAGAWAGLRQGTSNMDTLIALGTTVAWGYSAVAMGGYLLHWWHQLPELYFMESTGLLALISTGHYLEARARDAAGSAIHQLLDLVPPTALVIEAGAAGDGAGSEPMVREVRAAQVRPGDRVLVKPGQRVAVDGVVAEGVAEVDESMISGEPLPVRRGVGDKVIGGTVNVSGRLIISATQVGSQTVLAQIVKMVERAQSSKPPIQRLADRIAAVFVPAVLLIALATALGWYGWGRWHGWAASMTWGTMARSACSVLIIACPCALGLALPAALMVGTGRGARRGILIRDIDALQHAEHLSTVVLDKTGTITMGRPAVRRVVALNGVSEEELLRWAAGAEFYSEHPLARAIVNYARERNVTAADVDGFSSEAGFGVVAEIERRKVVVGNGALMEREKISLDGAASAAAAGVSIVYVGVRDREGAGRLVGLIEVADRIKGDSAAAIAELHAMNLVTVLLTGDSAAAAEAIAKEAGIDDVRAGVKPSEKAAVIKELQRRGARVAMVGDGINDAPALAQADLGIAIGSGSDIAKETGGIVLVSPSLRGIGTAIRLSAATMRKIRQNLFFAFVYNILAIPLAAMGWLNPLIAAGAMALSDVTVIGNALLLRRSRID